MTRLKYPRLPIVIVTWRDSAGALGWRNADEWDEWLESDGSIHETVGFLLRETADFVAIVGSAQLAPNPRYNDMMEIPSKSVLKIRVIETAKGKTA